MPESLTSETVTIRDVTFQIRKLLPMEAFRLLETLRPALKGLVTEDVGDVLERAESDDEAERGLTRADLLMLVNLVSGVDSVIVEKVRKQLFRRVAFMSGSQPSEVPLANNEELAFKDLDVFHIYEIFVRALAVNFIESWAAFNSRLPSENPSSG